MGWKLEVEGDVVIVDPTPTQVESALTCLRAEGPSFAILERDSGSYVQAGGSARDGLVVDARIMNGEEFTHSAAGRLRSRRVPRKTVKMSQGEQRVPSNEVLELADALKIFAAFHTDGTLAPGFDWRDRTRDFQRD